MKVDRGSSKNLKEIIDLSNLVFRPKERSIEVETPLMWAEKNIRAGNLFIIKEDKKIVSFTGMIEGQISICGYRLKISSIGNICTHPDYRGKGYASLLFQEAIKKAKSDNRLYLMISGGRGLYKRVGAVSVPFYFYQLEGKEARTDFEIRRYRNKFYKPCAQVYQREQIRFVREKDFRDLFSLYNGEFRKEVMQAKSSIYVILKDKEVLGYWTEGNSISVGCNREYAGTRELLTRAWRSRKGVKNVLVPLWDRELRYYLGKEKEIKEVGTVLLLNPESFVGALEGYYKERGVRLGCYKKGTQFLLKADSVEVKFKNISDLAAFLFCSHGKMPKGIWKEILPLPIPPYGFNYA